MNEGDTGMLIAVKDKCRNIFILRIHCTNHHRASLTNRRNAKCSVFVEMGDIANSEEIVMVLVVLNYICSGVRCVYTIYFVILSPCHVMFSYFLVLL